MKKQKFTETQIVKALKEYETGKNVADICRELGIHKATFYNWNKKYSGMEGQDLKRLKELEEENRRLSFQKRVVQRPPLLADAILLSIISVLFRFRFE